MKLLKITGLLAVLAFLAACGSTGASVSETSRGVSGVPGWMMDLEAEYPDAKYLAAVGSGDTRRGAENDATGALARLFTVNVKVDAVAQQRYAELVKGDKTYTESEKAISETVGTQANEQFVNLRFSDPYTDERGTTHAVAYIERESTAAIYRSLIQKDLAKLDDFLERASSMSGSLQRYAFYDAAYSVGLNAERMIGQLRIIHANTARLLESQLDLRKVAAARDSEAGKLTYMIAITGDADQRLAGIIRKTLESMSLSYQERGLLMVKGSWSVNPVTLTDQFKSVQWAANISLYDESGAAIATYAKQSRENGLNELQAANVAYRQVEKNLTTDFLKSIQNYLTRIVTGG
ncbi:MAG: LPP20 family lipoprotein [Spirochaetales bacterium]|nr:LPP20 family lipoprotein [Spirochaetales bacterium]